MSLARTEYKAKWREENKERSKLVRQAWREKNPGVEAKQWQLYYQENKERIKANYAAWREGNPDRGRNNALKRRYGITLDQYNEMFVSQDGACAICKEEETVTGKDGKAKPLCVDHNHTTGKVRALLCYRCNAGIGYLQDSPYITEQATKYLLDYQ